MEDLSSGLGDRGRSPTITLRASNVNPAINPYEPPPIAAESACGIEINGVMATCVRRGWISRTIRLTGTVQAEVRYEGGGFGERVFVDGTLSARTPFFTSSGDNVTPHIDFAIATATGEISAAIDVSARLIHLLRISSFKLTLYDSVVYEE